MEIAEADLSLVRVMHRDQECLGLFFETRRWLGGVAHREPDKCARLDWFAPEGLPDNVVPYDRSALTIIAAGERLAFFGWA